ncbi:MAG: 23S rRNA (pseudouridine(1915)-N(3))-methyltransferase RlmH [Nanoarchaeota archaeon]|nr:23S rRNA (pseudouridine(1915)-N(3))-methyltransferase RlmH [Nanoarchaeota archaeon]
MHYIYIYYVGSIKDSSIKQLVADISKRLKFVKFVELQLPKGSSSFKLKSQVQEIEREIIISKVFDKHDCVIICTEKGEEYSTQGFYSTLKKLDRELAFVISGAYGPHIDILNKASLKLSLSKLTFTHEMALYILIEQIYRAQCIENNIDYTK